MNYVRIHLEVCILKCRIRGIKKNKKKIFGLFNLIRVISWLQFADMEIVEYNFKENTNTSLLAPQLLSLGISKRYYYRACVLQIYLQI
jgi:hypothetical protein